MSLALAAALRWPHLGRSFSVDEYAYVTVARDILAGRLPLDGAWLPRGPIGLALYALPLALPIDVDSALHLFALLVSAATATVLFSLLRSNVSHGWAWFGSIAYALLSSDLAMQANGANTEHPINLFLVSSLALAYPRAASPSAGRLLLAGLAVGLAAGVKETMVVFALALVPALGPIRERGFAARTAALLSGVLLPWALTAAVYWLAGKLELISAVLSVHAGYSSLKPKDAIAAPLLLFIQRGAALYAVWPLLLPACWLLCDPVARGRFVWASRGSLAAAAVAVAVPGTFFAHYYFLLVPSLLLAAVLWLSSLQERGVSARICRGLAALFLAWLVGLELRMSSGRVPNLVRALDPFTDQAHYHREIGRAIAARASTQDRLLVFGLSPTTYVFAGLAPATPDIWGMTMGGQLQHWSWGMEPWFVRRVEAALAERPPDWVVLMEEPGSGEVDGAVASMLDRDYAPVELGIALDGRSIRPAAVFRREARTAGSPP